jgi:quercetin dioxygenase-like cupin family protein
MRETEPIHVRSALRVLNQADVEGGPGPAKGQTYQKLMGVAERPTDRVRLGRATYLPGSIEQLHWHPIEALYYVISGHATVRDIEDREYAVGPGSLIYAPAGIVGAHEWEVHDSLELLDIRATNVTSRKMQFTVDKATKRSWIDIEELARRDGLSFESHY